MGIPLYFRHLVNNFDDVLTSNKNLKQCDNLYLDLNCVSIIGRQIIKDGYNKIKDIIEKMIENIISYINNFLILKKCCLLLSRTGSNQMSQGCEG